MLSAKELSGEQLRAATPDLVVSSFKSWFTKDKVGTREELQSLGLPSYISAVDCPQQETGTPFERLFRDYEDYGKIFGIQDRANALIAKQRDVIKQATQTDRLGDLGAAYSPGRTGCDGRRGPRGLWRRFARCHTQFAG